MTVAFVGRQFKVNDWMNVCLGFVSNAFCLFREEKWPSNVDLPLVGRERDTLNPQPPKKQNSFV